ncbi:FecR family protein [Pseudomonas sp. microsymbiont 2]
MPQISPDPDLQRQAQDWLVRLTSGQATHADAQALRQWCARSPAHAEAFAQARQLWHLLGPAARQAREVAPMPVLGRRALLGGAVAASAALLVWRGGLLEDLAAPPVAFATEAGEQRRVELAAGIELELNVRTQVSRERHGIALLGGEIEVQARQPVQVRAGQGLISADLARFNVREDDEGVCVTCLSGELRIAALGQVENLPAGLQLRYGAQRVSAPAAFDIGQVMSWRERMLVFRDAPLAQVIDEINRYRPGRLILLNPSLGRRRVQARFSFEQLAQAAELIRSAYGARCLELPGGVVLVS